MADSDPVVPVADFSWSTTLAPATVDRPEYSRTWIPITADALGVAVMVGRVPPPAVIGAVHTLISVRSDALNCSTLTYVLPAESETACAVGLVLFRTPTMTTNRLPVVIDAVGVTEMFAAAAECAPFCWTKVGTKGIAALEAADAAPVPLALVAVTVNVYAVPLVNPVTVVLVPGGVPVIVVAVCAVDPTNGVIVYRVIALPPLAGAVQVTVADALPAVADTPVGARGLSLIHISEPTRRT